MAQESRDSDSSPSSPTASLGDPVQVPFSLWALAPSCTQKGSGLPVSTPSQLPCRAVPRARQMGNHPWLLPLFREGPWAGGGSGKLSLPSKALCTEESSTPRLQLSCSFQRNDS